MPDREKVIRWLEACSTGCEPSCPYEYENMVHMVECKADLMRDALELMLKWQELVNPVFVGNDEWQCPKCKTVVGWEELDCSGITETKYRYCPECGRRIAWE